MPIGYGNNPLYSHPGIMGAGGAPGMAGLNPLVMNRLMMMQAPMQSQARSDDVLELLRQDALAQREQGLREAVARGQMGLGQQQMGLDWARLGQQGQLAGQELSQRAQEAAQRFGLDRDRMVQAGQMFGQELGQRASQFGQTQDLERAKLAQTGGLAQAELMQKAREASALDLFRNRGLTSQEGQFRQSLQQRGLESERDWMMQGGRLDLDRMRAEQESQYRSGLLDIERGKGEREWGELGLRERLGLGQIGLGLYQSDTQRDIGRGANEAQGSRAMMEALTAMYGHDVMGKHYGSLAEHYKAQDELARQDAAARLNAQNDPKNMLLLNYQNLLQQPGQTSHGAMSEALQGVMEYYEALRSGQLQGLQPGARVNQPGALSAPYPGGVVNQPGAGVNQPGAQAPISPGPEVAPGTPMGALGGQPVFDLSARRRPLTADDVRAIASRLQHQPGRTSEKISPSELVQEILRQRTMTLPELKPNIGEVARGMESQLGSEAMSTFMNPGFLTSLGDLTQYTNPMSPVPQRRMLQMMPFGERGRRAFSSPSDDDRLRDMLRLHYLGTGAMRPGAWVPFDPDRMQRR